MQKQSSLSRKVKVTEEEKAKQEAKKAEAKKMKAEEKKNAEIAAKIAQATTRISSQKQQSSGNPQQSTELHLEGDNIQTLSLPAFREQQSLTASDAAVMSSKKQAAMKRKQKNLKDVRVHLHNSKYIRPLDFITKRVTKPSSCPASFQETA